MTDLESIRTELHNLKHDAHTLDVRIESMLNSLHVAEKEIHDLLEDKCRREGKT